MDSTRPALPLGAVAAAVVAVAFAVLGGIHVTHGTFDDSPERAVEYANVIAFAVALVGAAAAAPTLGAAIGAPVWATRCAVVGPLLVATAAGPTIVAGSTPGWFGLVAAPGNLAWLAGLSGMAVAAWRSRTLPRWAAAGLPFTVIAGVGLAQLGGGIVPALLWAWLAVAVLAPAAAKPSAAGA